MCTVKKNRWKTINLSKFVMFYPPKHKNNITEFLNHLIFKLLQNSRRESKITSISTFLKFFWGFWPSENVAITVFKVSCTFNIWALQKSLKQQSYGYLNKIYINCLFEQILIKLMWQSFGDLFYHQI